MTLETVSTSFVFDLKVSANFLFSKSFLHLKISWIRLIFFWLNEIKFWNEKQKEKLTLYTTTGTYFVFIILFRVLKRSYYCTDQSSVAQIFRYCLDHNICFIFLSLTNLFTINKKNDNQIKIWQKNCIWCLADPEASITTHAHQQLLGKTQISIHNGSG